MRHPQLDEILAHLKRYLVEAYGERLDRVILFGSQARGDARADSDIDVLIVLADEEVHAFTEINRIGGFVADLCLEYTVVISTIFTSKAIYESKRDARFYRNVHREGIVL
jgi:uncharacterized protein